MAKNVVKRSKMHNEYKGRDSKITKYITISEIEKNKVEMMKGQDPLENNWEMAMRIKEIIAENSENWRVFQKEKDEINERIKQKERRLEIVKEKKRKWDERKEKNESKEAHEKEMKRVEHLNREIVLGSQLGNNGKSKNCCRIETLP